MYFTVLKNSNLFLSGPNLSKPGPAELDVPGVHMHSLFLEENKQNVPISSTEKWLSSIVHPLILAPCAGPVLCISFFPIQNLLYIQQLNVGAKTSY